MKRLLFPALILALALLLSGCAGPQNSRSLKDTYAAIRQAEVLPEMVAVPEDMVRDFYGIDPAWYEEAVFQVASDSLLADEVVLIRAREEADADRILMMLKERLSAKAEEAKTYSPQQYAIINRGQILAEGRELALLVTPRVDVLLDICKGKYRKASTRAHAVFFRQFPLPLPARCADREHAAVPSAAAAFFVCDEPAVLRLGGAGNGAADAPEHSGHLRLRPGDDRVSAAKKAVFGAVRPDPADYSGVFQVWRLVFSGA